MRGPKPKASLDDNYSGPPKAVHLSFLPTFSRGSLLAVVSSLTYVLLIIHFVAD
jgi:hypothetical protein